MLFISRNSAIENFPDSLAPEKLAAGNGFNRMIMALSQMLLLIYLYTQAVQVMATSFIGGGGDVGWTVVRMVFREENALAMMDDSCV